MQRISGRGAEGQCLGFSRIIRLANQGINEMSNNLVAAIEKEACERFVAKLHAAFSIVNNNSQRLFSISEFRKSVRSRNCFAMRCRSVTAAPTISPVPERVSINNPTLVSEFSGTG